MEIMMGPVTTGRKEPHDLAHAEHFDESAEDHVDQPGYYDAARRIRQHLAGVPSAPSRGHSSIAAQDAKLEPRNAGTLPFVSRWNSSVPMPANSSAVETLIPVRMGTEHRRAKHGECVLHAQHQHLGYAQLTGVVQPFPAELDLFGLSGPLILPHQSNAFYSKHHVRCKGRAAKKRGISLIAAVTEMPFCYEGKNRIYGPAVQPNAARGRISAV